MKNHKLFFIIFLSVFFWTVFCQAAIDVRIMPKAPEKIIYDDDKTANNKEYFGWAPTNVATSAAVWKIMRITYTDNDFIIEFADGNSLYDNVWDNRASLTYK